MNRLTIRLRSTLTLLFLVGTASICTYIAKSLSLDAFKYIAVVFQVLATITTIKLLITYREQIDWLKAYVFLGILFLYPTLHILLVAAQSTDLKKITDGVFLIAPYYQLPIVALAITAHLERTHYNLDELIKQYLFLIVSIAGILAFFGLFQISAERVGNIYNLINNIFIPAAALLFFHQSLVGKIMAVMLFFTMVLLVALIGSRSYLMLCIYVVAFSTFAGSLEQKMMRTISLFAAASVFLLLILPFAPALINEDQVVLLQKFDMGSLLETTRTAISGGDLVQLYYWEGNSRAQVLLDAFADFDLSSLIFGKSVFGLYESFVVRNTIEVGWAQEAFWFGFVYIALVFLVMFASLLRHIMQHRSYKKSYTYFFSAIILIRFLDGWIYGMPTYDIYNLLFFMAVMAGCTNNTQRLNLRRSRQIEARGPRFEFRPHA